MRERLIVVDSSSCESITATTITYRLFNNFKIDKIELVYARVEAFNSLITIATDFVCFLGLDNVGNNVSTSSFNSTFCIPIRLNSSSELEYKQEDHFEQVADVNDGVYNKLQLHLYSKLGAPLSLVGKSFTFIFRCKILE